MTRRQGAVLLDTNVLSETARRQPDGGVMAFLDALDADSVYLSAITVAELERGIHLTQLRDLTRAQMLRTWFTTVVLAAHGDRILPFDLEVAQTWGQLMGSEAARRQPPAPQDSMIAATAVTHRLTVVTRNTADFLAFPVAVINPWRAGGLEGGS
ncbi:type II toxin-antitoxin system VapC family toxin [Deinococcus yunweiensis]|uniref:type II toxin-antitoxin system VapC family toxin n=1 Tax=Deinococcus yunweiensis TaxID=367282 RepID=UPI00398F3730